jgi:hypothetical protein
VLNQYFSVPKYCNGYWLPKEISGRLLPDEW